jgi:hypothetical protein
MPPTPLNQGKLSAMGSPFAQSTQGQSPFNNNASQSPFHNPSSQMQSFIPQGFNAPSFSGGMNSQQSISQSNDKLIQALSKLTQVISTGGKGGGIAGAVGMGGGINPTPTTANPTANNQQTQTIQNQTGTTTTANIPISTPIPVTNQNKSGMSIASVAASGLRAFNSAGSATASADLLSLLPGVGGMLAAPYRITGGMVGGIANLQAANKQRMLSAGVYGDVGLGANKDLNAFAKLGIDPNEAIGMQMQAQNSGFGRFTTQGVGATANLPFGMNLSRMAGLGFSGGTAGLFQTLGSTMNPNAINRNGLFSLGFNQGFNDIQMQGLAGGILGLQKNLFNQTGGGMNADTFNSIAALSSGAGAFMGERIQNIYAGMGGLIKNNSPFGDLGSRMIDLSVQQSAPGDYYAQAKERERLKGDPKAVAKILLEKSNGDIQTAKAIALSTGMSTTDIDTAFASIQISGENAMSGPISKAQQEFNKINELQFGEKAGGSAVNVAAQQAQYAIENVTKYSGKVAEVMKSDRQIQTDKLDTFDPKAAAEAIKKISEATSAANEVMFKVIKKLSDLVDKVEKVGFGKAIGDAIKEGFKEVGKKIREYLPF